VRERGLAHVFAFSFFHHEHLLIFDGQHPCCTRAETGCAGEQAKRVAMEGSKTEKGQVQERKKYMSMLFLRTN